MASSGKSENKLKPLPQHDRADVAAQMAELARQQREKASVARAKEEPPPRLETQPEPVVAAPQEPERKVKLKPRKKVRPLLPLLGGVLLLGAWFKGPEYFQQKFPLTPLPTQGVVTAAPSAEVYLGGQRLGETPLSFELPLESGTLELKRPGFLPQTVEVIGREEGQLKVPRYQAELVPGPIRLDWSQLPEVKSLKWQGTTAEVTALQEVNPGNYQLDVTPVEGPPLSLAVTVPEPQYVGPPGGVLGGDTVKVGEMVNQALAKRPVLELSISAPEGKKMSKVKVKLVRGKDQPLNLEFPVGETKRLVLTDPGDYKASIAASDNNQAWSQQWKLAEGQSENVKVALVAPKPKPEVAAGGYSGGGYNYRPPRYSGGGGGGHRISAPSF